MGQVCQGCGHRFAREFEVERKKDGAKKKRTLWLCPDCAEELGSAKKAVSNASVLAASLVPLRPWYRHKRGLSFADILRAAQTVLASVDVLDLGRLGGNLRIPPPAASPPSVHALKRAA